MIDYLNILKKNNICSKNDYYSVFVCIFACIPIINKIFCSVLPSLEGLLMFSLYAVSIVFFVLWLFFNLSNFRINIYHVAVIITILVCYFSTISRDVKSTESMIELVVYVIFPFLFFPLSSINGILFVKISMFVPVIGVFFLDKIFIVDLNSSIGMGTSYVFLLPIVSTIIYFFKIKEKRTYLLLLGSLNFIYLYYVFLHGSRGTILCILLCFIFCFATKKNVNGGVTIKKLPFIVISLVIFFCFLFFFDLIFVLNDYLVSRDVHVGFLNKFIRLSYLGDLTNGRSLLTDLVVDGIKESPLVGHGVSSFMFYTGYLYPHNFILQFFYDIGIPLTVFLIFLSLRGLYRWFLFADDDKYVFFIVVFCSSVPAAFFSGDLWKSTMLWLTISFLLCFNLKEVEK